MVNYLTFKGVSGVFWYLQIKGETNKGNRSKPI